MALEGLGDTDGIALQSWIEEDEAWVPYQNGTLASLLPLDALLSANPLGEGAAMLCGTLAALGGVRPAGRFRARLGLPDGAPALDYGIRSMPVRA